MTSFNEVKWCNPEAVSAVPGAANGFLGNCHQRILQFSIETPPLARGRDPVKARYRAGVEGLQDVIFPEWRSVRMLLTGW